MRRWISLALVAGCGSSHGAGIDAPPGGGDAPDAPSADAGPCGVRTNNRGLTHRMVNVGGLDRTYLVYLPDVDAQTPIPFVGVFHGYTMSGQAMYDATAYAKLADTEHIALVFPDGEAGPNSLGAPWNVGTNLCPSVAGPPPTATGDDFAFLDAMKADVAQDQCLDENHVYVTGFSMGGYFSHHTGCMRPDIRAVAPHSGGTHDLAGCPSTHKPIIIFHGTSDPVIPDGCDDPGGSTPSGYTASAAAWAAKNGCGTTTTSMAVDNGTCVSYDNCPADGQVVLCTFNSMGHCWAGGTGTYGCPGYASATQLEWQFFKEHAW